MARVQLVVTGVPAGDLVFGLTFEDGRLADACLRSESGSEVGADAAAEVTITTTVDDFRLLATGDLDLNVAVMQGRAKVAGPTAPLLAALPLTRTPEFRSALAALQEQTATAG
jgi:putative sterol carrier protein